MNQPVDSAAERQRFDALASDPDAADTTTTPLPLHAQWRLIAVVAVGGACGTGIREALALTHPAAKGGMPWATLTINVVGAFVLGLLLEVLARRGPDEGRRRLARLFLGTGVLGGFTTYSALATDTANLMQSHPQIALEYALGTVVLGALAAWAGVVLAGRWPLASQGQPA